MRPITVSVGPLATADSNGVFEAQQPAGEGSFALNGVLSDFSSTNIAPSQTLSGAETLALVNSPVYLAGNQYVVISAIGDESLVNFTITGIAQGGIGVSETLAGPNAGVVVSAKQYSQILSVSSDAGTSDDVEVGTWTAATFDQPRRLLLTFAADETGTAFTVTGTDRTGNVVSEVMAGSASTTLSKLDYATITSILTSATASGAIIAGTTDVASSGWARMDDWAPNYISIQNVVSGTVNYTIEYTLNDPNSPWSPVASADVVWVSSDDTDVVAATGNSTSNFIFAPAYARVKLNSGDGAVNATFLQSFGGV